jgi:hypothetical protein
MMIVGDGLDVDKMNFHEALKEMNERHEKVLDLMNEKLVLVVRCETKVYGLENIKN